MFNVIIGMVILGEYYKMSYWKLWDIIILIVGLFCFYSLIFPSFIDIKDAPSIDKENKIVTTKLLQKL